MKAKHIILIILGFIIIFNTFAGAILEAYETSAWLWLDLSLAITGGLLYFLFASHIADGFKISMSIILSFSGIVRAVIMANIGTSMQNNIPLLVTVLILFLEIGGICLVSYLSKK